VGYWVLQYTMGIADAPKIARAVLSDYRGTPERQLLDDGEACFEAYIREHLSTTAMQVVERHRQAGDFVAIVTTATRYLAEPIARAFGIDQWLCSELEVDASGQLTGRLGSELCYGVGKVARVRLLLARLGARFDDVSFYSDSITDLPLLELAEHPVVINPDYRLRRVARRRGWPVERW
jgi:HAD superfamily hydrolase (TIGR01490 family)